MDVKTEKKLRSSKKILGAGALGLSTVFHLAIMFLVGGAVIIQGVLPKDQPTGELLTETDNEMVPLLEEPMAEEPSNSPEEPTSIAETSVPVEFASPTEVVTTSSPAPAFTMPAVSPSSVSGVFGEQASSSSSSETTASRTKPRAMPSPFGRTGATTDGLVGYLYDLKQTVNGKELPYTPAVFEKTVAEFIKKGWDPKVLEPFFKIKKAMTASQFCIPQMDATEVPKAFNVERQVQPKGILVHYQGTFIAPKSGSFRFAGNGDDILLVRLNRKDVLNTSSPYVPASPLAVPFPGSKVSFSAGEWFQLSKGQTYSMEVLIGERPGGLFHAFLMIQEKAGKYDMDPLSQVPILPLFQTTATEMPKYTPFPKAQRNPPSAKEAFAGLEAATPDS